MPVVFIRHGQGDPVPVRFFKGTPFKSIEQTFKDVHSIGRDTCVMLRDEDGHAVAISDKLPDQSQFTLSTIPAAKESAQRKRKPGSNPAKDSMPPPKKAKGKQCTTPANAHGAVSKEPTGGKRALFTPSPAKSSGKSKQGKLSGWSPGDKCEARVDGEWRPATVKKVRKGRIYINVEGMLGQFFDKTLRRVPVSPITMAPQGDTKATVAPPSASSTSSLDPVLTQLDSQDDPRRGFSAGAPAPKSTTSTFSPVTCADGKGVTPPPMWGATATVISGGKMILYGGNTRDGTSEAIYSFDTDKQEWSELPLSRKQSARSWHSAVHVPDQSLIFIFGGEAVSNRRNPKPLAHPLLFDTELHYFYPPATNGREPAPRSGHSCTRVGDKLVIFGGCCGSARFGDIHVLSLSTWSWSQPKTWGQAPAPRSYHSAHAVGNAIVIFGGSDEDQCFKNAFALDTENWVWRELDTGDAAIAPRAGHAVVSLQGRSLFVGGWDPLGPRTDVYFPEILSLDHKTWKLSKWSQDCKALARVGHTAFAGADQERIFVFGGRAPNDVLLSDVQVGAAEMASKGGS